MAMTDSEAQQAYDIWKRTCILDLQELAADEYGHARMCRDAADRWKLSGVPEGVNKPLAAIVAMTCSHQTRAARISRLERVMRGVE